MCVAVCASVSPVFVDEVYAERVGGQLHQAVHGHVHITAAGRLPGPQSQTVVHQTARIPATHTHTHYVRYYDDYS